MTELKIKVESFPARCEICHQADCFDPQNNFCSRCENIKDLFGRQFVKLGKDNHFNWKKIANLFKPRGPILVGYIITFVIITLFSLKPLLCLTIAKQKQPKYPGKVLGWVKNPKKDDWGLITLGVLVLKKGESSDNGKIGIRVVDITEGDPCAGCNAYLSARKVILQFYRPSDNAILCEKEFSDNSTGTLDCPSELKVSGYGIQSINTEENWVLFDLRGSLFSEHYEAE